MKVYEVGRPFFSSEFYQDGWTMATFLGAYAVVLLCAAVVCAGILAIPWVSSLVERGKLPEWGRLAGVAVSVVLAGVAYAGFWMMMGPIGEHLPAYSYGGKVRALLWWLVAVAGALMFVAVLVPLKRLRLATGRSVLVAGGAAVLPGLATTVNLATTGIPVVGGGLTVLTVAIIAVVVYFALNDE